jgi:hypothetical protein
VPGVRPHDHAFDDQLDAATWCRRIVVVVPTKSDQRRNPRFDKAADWQRDRVGRTSNGSKQHRRVATW